MPDATRLSPLLNLFQWSRAAAPNPRLSAPIDADDTTITFTSAPQDEDGVVVTGDFLMGVKNQASYTELIYVPAAGMSADGLTATGVIRGIDISGTDFNTANDADFAASHEQDSPVFCAVNAVYANIVRSAIQGGIATGGTDLILGNDAAATVTVRRSTGVGTNSPWIRWNTTTSQVEFSDDGAAWTAIVDVTASNLIVVSGADTTPADLSTKLVSATGGIDFNILGGGGNETLNLVVDLTEVDIVAGPLANVISDVTTTEAELDQALDGISANVTAANLNTLTAGASSSADALHMHSNPVISFTAAEAVTAGNAVALLPIEVEYFSQLTDANLALGDSNVRRRYAIRITPSVTTSSLTTMIFRAAEAVNGATTLGDLNISIQTDNAGEPSGTIITNGSANAITQATQRTWNTTQGSRTATWAAAPTLTAGTTYWIVFAVSATDAVNFLNLSVNSSHDENYVTFTRLTFNLDAGTWGGSTTTATPFFWFNNQLKLLGAGVVPTDANWGARTWNFIGFARTTVVVNASVDVYYDIVPGLTGLLPGLDYCLDEDPVGGIQIPAPTSGGTYVDNTAPTAFTYKIGRAISTTTLRIEKGPRMVYGYAEDSNTTTYQFILWFRPQSLEIAGAEGTTGSYTNSSNGFWNGSLNVAAVDRITANTHSGVIDANSSFSSDEFAGTYYTAAASALSDIGITYTVTEAGAATDYDFVWKATA